mgnify:CR=1 FL=1
MEILGSYWAEHWLLAVLILGAIAFVAGFVDSIAGGGGLITLPALFLAGVDPISAIATNKFQAASATVSATVTFARKGMIEWREGRFLVICGFIGGASGALLVSSVDKRYLEVCVPVMLILVAIYFALSPKLANEDRRKRIGILLFSFTVAPILGFYDGIFGPGVGSFFIVGFVLLCGLGMMRAMSFTKLVVDAQDRVWVGTLDGLVVRDTDGVLRRAPESFGLGHGLVWPYRGPDGVVWIVAGERIYRMQDGVPQLQHRLPGVMHITAMLQDRHGDLWLGTENQGLLRISAHGLERLPAGLNLPGGRVVTGVVRDGQTVELAL